jgi:hypothetical protein
MSQSTKNSANNALPMSDWLILMLAEIERKDTEAGAAADERKRRASDEPQHVQAAGSAHVA